MAAPFNLVSLPSRSGLNSAEPPTYIAPDELVTADNITYGYSGVREKRLGTTRYNTGTSVTGSSANVNALMDFWRYSTSLTPTQNFVAVIGGQIMRSTTGGATGAWSLVTSSFSTNSTLTANIVQAQGFAVFSDGYNSTGPVKYDQTTATPVSTTSGLPNFTMGSYHLRRLFVAGEADNPSRVKISAGGDIQTWGGADTGNFVLEEDDGDQIMAISRPWHKRLYIFKGPQFGSIHEIAGNTLAALTRDRIFDGLPIHNHKALITTPTDIFWLSHAGIHSLQATQQYGDTTAAFLSLPIQDFFENDLNHDRIDQCVGFWNPLKGIVGWMVPPAGQTTNQWALVYYYLISDSTLRGKKFWAIWKFSDLAGFSAQVMLTPQAATVQPGQQRLYIGGSNDGFVYAGDQPTLTDANGSAYTTTIQTGILLNMAQAGNALQEKQFLSVTTFYEPVGTYDHTLTAIIDNRQQTKTIQMAGLGDKLG